jgi:hypothetical protein
LAAQIQQNLVKRRGQLEVRENGGDFSSFSSSFPILVTELDIDTDVSPHMSLDTDVLPPFRFNRCIMFKWAAYFLCRVVSIKWVQR